MFYVLVTPLTLKIRKPQNIKNQNDDVQKIWLLSLSLSLKLQRAKWNEAQWWSLTSGESPPNNSNQTKYTPTKNYFYKIKRNHKITILLPEHNVQHLFHDTHLKYMLVLTMVLMQLDVKYFAIVDPPSRQMPITIVFLLSQMVVGKKGNTIFTNTNQIRWSRRYVTYS